MRRVLTGLMAIVMAGWLAGARPVIAEEAKEPVQKKSLEEKAGFPVDFGFQGDLLGKYVFRGFTFSEKPQFLSSLSATHANELGCFTLIGYGNFDTKSKDINELDIAVDYTRPIKEGLNLSIGYGLYVFPNTDTPKTQEVYEQVGLEHMLNPSLTAVYDFDDGDGTYVEYSVGHDFSLGKTRLSANALLGYNDHYYRRDSGLSHAELKLALPISLGKVTVTPSVVHSYSLDDVFQTQTYGALGVGL
jgi:hypothetical protein